jgi:D-serine deaminase-like pyridoxal phosphate-dependent protein
MLNEAMIILYNIFMDLYPRLLVNQGVVARNLNKVKSKLDLISVNLRPHVKTIHDPQLSDILRASGIDKICVSNASMMRAFVDAGWRDICLAIPFPMNSLDALVELCETTDLKITLYVDDESQIERLMNISVSFRLAIEIDTGQRRSGIDWKHRSRIIAMIDHIQSSNHTLDGLTAHFGGLYLCNSKDEIYSECANHMMKILQLKEQLDRHYSDPISLAIGDTPSVLTMDYFDNVSEVRAGNFLFNDLTIYHKGVCDRKDIACAIEAVVISKNACDCRFVLHCGSIHLSKERHDDPSIQYGHVCTMDTDWEPLSNTVVHGLYQEHAVVVTTPDIIDQIHIGDRLLILPVHSCLAVDAMHHKKRIHYMNQ